MKALQEAVTEGRFCAISARGGVSGQMVSTSCLLPWFHLKYPLKLVC